MFCFVSFFLSYSKSWTWTQLTFSVAFSGGQATRNVPPYFHIDTKRLQIQKVYKLKVLQICLHWGCTASFHSKLSSHPCCSGALLVHKTLQKTSNVGMELTDHIALQCDMTRIYIQVLMVIHHLRTRSGLPETKEKVSGSAVLVLLHS